MKMLLEKILNFEYKGQRTYVHGTDIYDSMLGTVRKHFEEYPRNITGSFHRLLTSNGIFRIYEDQIILDHESYYAFFTLRIRGKTYYAALSATGVQISSAYAYDEDKLLEGTSVRNATIKMIVKSVYTYIEQIVAMTKRLHITLYPEVKGKWLFTKIQISNVIDPDLFAGRELAIKSENNFHYKLTKNSINLDAIPLGTIWFSLAV